jgi:hypothetical protein
VGALDAVLVVDWLPVPVPAPVPEVVTDAAAVVAVPEAVLLDPVESVARVV